MKWVSRKEESGEIFKTELSEKGTKVQEEVIFYEKGWEKVLVGEFVQVCQG